MARFGDPFLIHPLNGSIVVTGRADLIRQIYGADPDTFTPFAVDTLRPLLGAGSLILMDGDPHRRERKLLMPMFHGDRMKSYADAIHDIAMEAADKRAGQTETQTLPMMAEISLNAIARTIFGGDEPKSLSALLTTSRELIGTLNPLLFFSKRMQFPFLGLSPWDRFTKARDHVYASLDNVIDQRRKSNATGKEDILSMLMEARYEDGEQISQDHIRHELMTFLFAGHETSALGMTWAIYHLLKNPETLANLKDELSNSPTDSPASLAQLPYLKAIVQETLRLNPLVTEVLRILKKPMELGEYRLPAGMAVAPAAILAHYNPETYPEPDRFRPERFLERSYSPFEYMPFGGGNRRCIGAAFASFEMAIVLGTFIKRFDWDLLETKPLRSTRRSVTMGPSTNVRVRFVKK